jgi:nicotinamidase-related amidase
MSDQAYPRTGLDALLTPDNCTLLLIDHQPFQFSGLGSHDPQTIINNVVGLAKSAKLFGVPTLLSTVLAARGGALLPSLQAVFPEQEPIDRTWINSWEDPNVVEWVEKTGRKKVIVAGMWTEICVAHPVIQALGEGYDVYFVTDASGGVSVEAHEVAIQRMVQAGAVPITWMVLAAELQRDWAREETVAGYGEILGAHAGSTGTGLAWELQLLASASAAPAGAAV